MKIMRPAKRSIKSGRTERYWSRTFESLGQQQEIQEIIDWPDGHLHRVITEVLSAACQTGSVDQTTAAGISCPPAQVYDSPNPHRNRLLNKTSAPCRLRPFIFSHFGHAASISKEFLVDVHLVRAIDLHPVVGCH